MTLELVHASVARGLRGGSGFSTVAQTRGMPQALVSALEELSAYDPDPARAIGADPIERAHRILALPSGTYTVLSRIEPCGVDASGRPNRIAHHLVVDGSERGAGGPAAAIARFSGWERAPGEAEERGRGPAIAAADVRPRIAEAWRSAGLDPGWAGVVAQQVVDRPQAPCYLVFEDRIDLLPLIEDVLALLPPERRWMATFSTRYRRYPPHVRCQIRCVLGHAPGVAALLAEPGIAIFRVGTSPSAALAGIDAGRHGRSVEPSASRAIAPRVQPALGDADREEPPSGGLRARAPQAAVQPTGLSAASSVASSAASPLAPTQRLAAPARRAIGEGGRPVLGLDLVLFLVAGAGALASFVLLVLLLLRS